MNKSVSGKKRGPARAARQSVAPRGKIHPVIIYPFRQSADYSDLTALYELIARLDKEKSTYARPITVMDRKTHQAMSSNAPFLDFRKQVVGRYSDILDAWCVDTCQMWYSGLGRAFESGAGDDV